MAVVNGVDGSVRYTGPARYREAVRAEVRVCAGSSRARQGGGDSEIRSDNVVALG